MRLVTFEEPGGRRRIGAVMDEGSLLDLTAAEPALPEEMLAFICGGPEMLERARRVIETPPAAAILPLSRVRLRAPLLRPGKMVCAGQNFAAHAAEQGIPGPPMPTGFPKFATAIISPGDPIVRPRGMTTLDYECEVAAVIGRRACNVREGEALQHVFGYCILNDVSGRAVQRAEMKQGMLVLGKNFPTFAPMGPWLVTADEVGDPGRLRLRTLVNGEVRQDSDTSDMIYGFPKLVSYWSQLLLEPGDVLSSGTPSGVAAFRAEPDRYYLKPGDEVVCEVERLGVLRNPVVEAG